MSFPTYAEYKDSGVKWLGSIPSHWEVVQSRRLFRARREAAKEDDVMLTASQKYGMIPQAEFVEKEGRRVVEVIQGKENLIHVEPDDFVISMRSFQGGLEWCRYTGSTSFHYVPVTPIKNVIPSFFAHLLKSAPYISALRSTTNLIRDGQEIRYSNFVQAPLPVVPKQEQLAIASFLDRETAKIDALIAEQQRLIELLQEKRQAVISHAVTKGLNPNAPMKDSGVEWLGGVPEHWEVRKASQLFNGIGSGTTPKSDTTEYYEDGFIPWVITGDLNDGVLGACQNRVTEKAMAEHSTLRLYPADSVAVAMYGATIGKAAVMDFEATVNQACCVLPPSRLVNSKYLLGFILAARKHLLSVATGGGQPNINQEVIRSLRMPLPSIEEQARVVGHLESATSEMDSLLDLSNKQVLLLQERRSALISAAVTGQIDVRGLATEEEP